ncbi:MAG: solute:Na+ symporter, family [Acidobacteriota bacterium]|nr:solute:Na+ symporter, family [Acidobacteriota bacterium]
MSALDWLVLAATLAAIVIYGMWRGRRHQHLEGYLLADRQMRWPTIALSIMATQASAITFLSTPGQAYTDGMRFLQFYLGLPIAMIILCAFFVPVFHRLKVFTAYEFLERRFGIKTRTITASLFLLQRGLSTGITIYAPALIISVLLGWNIHITNIVIGTLVILYTTTGGTRAVSWTHVQQMLIILGGMATALVIAIRSIPADITVIEAVKVAGRMGRLNAIDFTFDFTTPYNFWGGMIGGLLVALSYFGADQSQVQRYLTGETLTESRLGLLFNGMVKVPMQFFILFTGAMVFVFYQFVAPPLIFNTVERAKIGASRYALDFDKLEAKHNEQFNDKRTRVHALVDAMRSGDSKQVSRATDELRVAQAQEKAIHAEAVDLLKQNDKKADGTDTNYIFLTFVLRFLPAGVVGLVMAAIFCASMSSTASGLNSLASSSVIDIYKRHVNPHATQHEYVRVSRWLTVGWGLFAIGFAEYVNRLGSLIEAVNRLGSLFYGTILAVFVLALFTKELGEKPVIAGAIIAEAATIYCWLFTKMAWLWWNVVGFAVAIVAALIIEKLLPGTIVEEEVEIV